MNSKDHSEENIGFHYTVSEDQVVYYRNRTVKDIFRMNEAHARFIWSCQTPQERERMKLLKGKLGG